MTIVIYHNPACGTSRNVVAIAQTAGETPIVIDCLIEGWTRPQLLAPFAAAGLTPRTSKSQAEELELLNLNIDDDTKLDAMLEHPVLVNRPIVSSSKGTRLCRPCEAIFDLLDQLPPSPLAKEDGTPLLDAEGNRLV